MKKLYRIGITKRSKNSIIRWRSKLIAYLCKHPRIVVDKIPKTITGKYNNPTIKKILLKESQKRCAYCESTVVNTGYGEIDHIVPKSKYPFLMFEYENFVISCQRCNNSKDNFYNFSENIIDPYLDDPELHLSFQGATLHHITNRGRNTIDALELNDLGKLEHRENYLEPIEQLWREYNNHSDPLVKKCLANLIKTHKNRGRDYSVMVETYINSLGLP